MTKVQLEVMLGLSNVIMKLSNMRKKKVSLNMTKVQLEAMLVLPNVTIEPPNLKKEKEKGTAKCYKRIVTCDIRTAKCEVEIVKCEKKYHLV